MTFLAVKIYQMNRKFILIPCLINPTIIKHQYKNEYKSRIMAELGS
jgi:hypothetical protein